MNTSLTAKSRLERGTFFASAANGQIVQLDNSSNNNNNNNENWKITHFFLLKRYDFGLKIVGELRFELVFKQLDQLYRLEATSVGTMWSIVSALANASKLLNKEEDSSELGNDISIQKNHWSQYYIKRCITISNNNNHSSSNSESIDEELLVTKTAETSITAAVDENLANNSVISSLPSDLLDHNVEYNLNPRESQSKPMLITSNTIKDEWIKAQLKLREDEFTELKEFKVVVATWNVNSKAPKKSLRAWLQLDKYEADIYAIGLQEIDMTAGALLKEETDQGTAWTNRFDETFGATKSKYCQIKARQLVGIYHAIYIKERYSNHVSEIRSSAEGVGVLGMMGNKGGVAIRFKLYETTFCFINAHLAPHMSAISRRNQNYQDIIKRTTFNGGARFAPEKHDFFFWLGDLNYRINLPDKEARELIKQKNYSKLLEYDQLTIEHKAGRVLNGMLEGKINFQPTYKFDAGTNNYDTSEKSRVPAYTDRIFWMDRENVKQEYYESHMEYMASDHKPVVAGFIVGVKIVQQDKYYQLYKDLIKTLDKLENDMLPEIKLSAQEYLFDNVRYGIPVIKTLELENTGQVVCEFHFVPKAKELEICKRWLHIEPTAGIIIPGEKTEIKLTLLIDNGCVSDFNFDKDKIDDILILHLKNGRDHFISLHGNFLKTCFGNSLENLVSLGHPVRGTSSSFITKVPHKIPVELWRMVDYIYKKGLEVESIFKESGSPSEKQYIMEQLDKGEPFGAELDTSETAPHSFAELLLGFLESLSEPVVPYKFYKVCIEASASSETCIHIATKFPPVHFNTFHHLMDFAREFIKHKDFHLVEPDELAIIFSKVLLRPPKNYSPIQAMSINDQRAKLQFIKHFFASDVTWTEQELVAESNDTRINANYL
jgi:phosphatidylinositol-bisphosphatase